MNAEFFEALDLIEKEKGIPKEYMLEKVEAALISAYKRDKNGNANVRIAIDADKKTVRVFQQMEIVETVENPDTQISFEEAKEKNKRAKLGGIYEVELKTKDFRRLAAQNAKQVIVQGIREAERAMIVKEYESKREEIVTATVIKTDELSGNVVLDTGTSNATLLQSEQIPGERFAVGDRVKVYITEVSRETRGHIVTLSRKHPGLVKRMFELEIPEWRARRAAVQRLPWSRGMKMWIRSVRALAIGARASARSSTNFVERRLISFGTARILRSLSARRSRPPR